MIKVISCQFNCCLFCEHSLRLSVAGPRYKVYTPTLPGRGASGPRRSPPWLGPRFTLSASGLQPTVLLLSSRQQQQQRLSSSYRHHRVSRMLPGSTAPLFPGYRRIHKSTLFLSPSYWPHRAIRCRLNTFQSMYVYQYKLHIYIYIYIYLLIYF